MYNNFEQLESSIKLTINNILNRYYEHNIDIIQCMEQLQICSSMVHTYCDTLTRTDSNKDLISKLIKLRDNVSLPLMQLVYDQVLSIPTITVTVEKKEVKDKTDMFKLEIRRRRLCVAAI